MLINVLHFKSDWAEKFNNELTKEKFHPRNSPDIQVDMMFGEFGNAGYQELPNGGVIVSLPFSDPNYEMVFVKPKNDIETFVQEDLISLLPSILDPSSLDKSSLNLQMPKFNLEKKANLKETLSKVVTTSNSL